jgi:hypothetical protein
MWKDKTIPDHWHWKLLCPIPKTEVATTVLANLRPIMLVEALRKLWVGITVKKMANLWFSHRIMSPDQFGYTRTRSTVTSCLSLINTLDDFEANSRNLFLGLHKSFRYDTLRPPPPSLPSCFRSKGSCRLADRNRHQRLDHCQDSLRPTPPHQQPTHIFPPC